MKDLVLLRNCQSKIQAGLYMQVLADNNIESFIADDHSPFVFSFQGANLMVFENDLSKASKVLEDFQEESIELEVEHTLESRSGGPICPDCGSNNTYGSTGNEYCCYYCSFQWIIEPDSYSSI